MPSVSIPSSGLDIYELARLWEPVDLTALEDEVIRGLQLITPELTRVSITPAAPSFTEPVIRAKLSGHPRPVPFGSLGDGMHRILGITLAIVSARNGVVLVDEIENGVHYAAQPQLWRLIFTLAAEHNVQVFATTHSYDCIQAFQEAANESPEEGVLIRLQRKQGELGVTLFSEEELAIATRHEIEVR